MQTSFPRLRRITQSLGIYRPLHRQWIGILARRTGTAVRCYANGVFDLTRGDRTIRYDNWDMAYFLAASFDYYFAAVEPVIWQGQKLVDYSHPGWHRLSRCRELFYFGSLAEPEETTDLYLRHGAPRPGDVVFDMGAYNGTQTVFFSRAVGTEGRVFAFEPDPQSFVALRQNLDYHECGNVQVIEAGVWSSSGTLSFCSDGSMGSSLVTEHIHQGRTIQIQVVSPADVIERHGLTRLDFCKIDIEGAELEVLRAMEPLLKHFRPRIVVETHERDGRNLKEEIVPLLTTCGYHCETLDQGQFDLPLVVATPA